MKAPFKLGGIVIDDTPASVAEWEQIAVKYARLSPRQQIDAIEARAAIERKFGDLSSVPRDAFVVLYWVYWLNQLNGRPLLKIFARMIAAIPLLLSAVLLMGFLSPTPERADLRWLFLVVGILCLVGGVWFWRRVGQIDVRGTNWAEFWAAARAKYAVNNSPAREERPADDAPAHWDVPEQ
ncbi:MAG: hypothetical protein AAFS01_05415 [Pseudomonadota bacterium]